MSQCPKEGKTGTDVPGRENGGPRNGGHVSLTGLWDTQERSSKRRLGEFTEVTLPKKPGLHSRGARELLRVSQLHILKHRDWGAEGMCRAGRQVSSAWQPPCVGYPGPDSGRWAGGDGG